jgi:hypothetical protein
MTGGVPRTLRPTQEPIGRTLTRAAPPGATGVRPKPQLAVLGEKTGEALSQRSPRRFRNGAQDSAGSWSGSVTRPSSPPSPRRRRRRCAPISSTGSVFAATTRLSQLRAPQTARRRALVRRSRPVQYRGGAARGRAGRAGLVYCTTRKDTVAYANAPAKDLDVSRWARARFEVPCDRRPKRRVGPGRAGTRNGCASMTA